MSVLSHKLNELREQEIVVVMADNRAFRGTLVEFDDDAMLLRNVVEALPMNTGGWEEPTVSTTIKHKVVTWHGTFSHDDAKGRIVRLKDVVIRLQGVLRIWEYSEKNLAAPEHVDAEGDAEDRGPAPRVSRS